MKNLRVVDVRPDQNLILVQGAVPGGRNGILMIRRSGRF
jgi:large subunit ribosomal protein L3